MNRRDLLKGLASTTSYFFLGGIYRPAAPEIVIDHVNQVIRFTGFKGAVTGTQLFNHLKQIFPSDAMPMRWASPGWRLTTVDGWRLDRR